MRNLLDKIESPADIRHLSMNELKELCAELRDYMIECCSTNPGHLGSSLGAVELVVGIHYVFNTPEDKVVFDVGHQAYAHKILTGRKEIFRQNRKKDGISGFPKRSESIYDAFGAGHSSTSISAALGIAQAEKARETGNKTIALIGDGALSGGLAFEGLNNASEADLLMIINDNNISIDKNIGGIHEHLLNLTTHPTYNRLKDKVWNRMGEGKLREKIQRSVIRLKSNLVSTSGGDLFEALGLRYFGPVDGNDIVQVVGALQKLKSLKGPRVLHTITVKGKGYAPAEEDQTTWHAPGKFDPVDGKRLKNGDHKESRYQDVFGQVLLEVRFFVFLEDFVGGVSLENPLRDIIYILLDYTHHLLHLVKTLEQAVEKMYGTKRTLCPTLLSPEPYQSACHIAFFFSHADLLHKCSQFLSGRRVLSHERIKRVESCCHEFLLRELAVVLYLCPVLPFKNEFVKILVPYYGLEINHVVLPNYIHFHKE